jgi:hypothetical protein
MEARESAVDGTPELDRLRDDMRRQLAEARAACTRWLSKYLRTSPSKHATRLWFIVRRIQRGEFGISVSTDGGRISHFSERPARVPVVSEEDVGRLGLPATAGTAVATVGLLDLLAESWDAAGGPSCPLPAVASCDVEYPLPRDPGQERPWVAALEARIVRAKTPRKPRTKRPKPVLVQPHRLEDLEVLV